MSYRPPNAALLLLVLSALVNYGYEVFPLAVQADVQNVFRAVALVILGAVVLALSPCWTTVLAFAVWALEQLIVAGCSVAYILRGSPATDPGNQCTGLWHYDFNGLGVALLAGALVFALRRDSRRWP